MIAKKGSRGGRALPPRRLNPLAAAVLMAGFVMTGCVMGPDFNMPTNASDNYAYTAKPVATEQVEGTQQQIASGKDIPAQWWQIFQSEALDQLVREALRNSPNLAAAQAALRQAQETYTAQTGATLYPNVNASLGAQRQQLSQATSGAAGGTPMSLYNASVNVSYSVDVFGATKRGLEAAQASVDAQRFQLEATYLALTANVVTAAIREAATRAQLHASEEMIATQEKQLTVVEQQFQIGSVTKSSVLAQKNLLAQTRANIPALQKALSQTRQQLAVLLGRLPNTGELPEFELDKLKLPQEIPLSIPSALVRQRPDIRIAEAQWHQASAAVGVATANQYPQLNLSAAYGYTGTDSGHLFSNKTNFWNLGAGLVAPIFNAGALAAKQRAAVASYDLAAAQYRATVLQAFQNVADSLRALEFDSSTLKQQAEAEALARQTLDLSAQQFRLGGVSSLALLDAQRTHQAAKIALVQAQASRYADTAALFQALGGGWWNRAELADISHTTQSGDAAQH